MSRIMNFLRSLFKRSQPEQAEVAGRRYHVYYYTQAVYQCDRTYETRKAAQARVAELQATGKYEQVIYTIDFVIKGAFLGK